MPPIQEILSAEHIEGAVSIVGIWIILNGLDYLIQRFFDEKLFARLYSIIKKKAKAFWTKRNHIKAELELSFQTTPDVTVNSAINKFDTIVQALPQESNGEFEVKEVWEKSQTELRAKIAPARKDTVYRVDIQYIPQPTERGISDTAVSSIGVCIEFNFAFEDLKGAIINLMAFTGFLKRTIAAVYPVTSASEARFVVTPIENDLTLDKWIQKEQFDVSLLLRSPETERRSVEFYGDRAEITSPHDNVDDETVEYIRATLLNYYL